MATHLWMGWIISVAITTRHEFQLDCLVPLYVCENARVFVGSPFDLIVQIIWCGFVCCIFGFFDIYKVEMSKLFKILSKWSNQL